MSLYQRLARVFPRSFSARLLAVACVGLQVPLLGLLGWMLWQGDFQHGRLLPALAVVLVATLAGGGATLLALHRLLAPLRAAADALDAYYEQQRLPHLPDLGQDEIGRVLRGINRSLHGVDAGLADLHRSVLLDPLTEALNRRGCEQALAESAREAQDNSWPFVLFVVDLDNLKPINDRFGHQAGDQVLVRLVESAYHWLGAQDWIGRWGGDEFLVGVHAEHHIATAKLRQWLAALEQPRRAEDPPVQASAGWAAYRPGEDLRGFYARADAAMYRAKYAGGRQLQGEDGGVQRQTETERT
ncbi:GGDEF domain-containing protein [Stenotrophomonas sp. YIM B06876]|uniref:GGDEF domain-containing protein n=1 Tax=Stenotrophomonas sp. YIM B06876 TaxID=3060211 RepID=UPI002738F3DD|nr:GGDEF domain-containing protein [Stenotrophomonas sp. YIM B06876]